MRSMAQLLIEREIQWTQIANQFIQVALRTGPHKKERKHWQSTDALLLDLKLKISKSPLPKGMLKGWAQSKMLLKFEIS